MQPQTVPKPTCILCGSEGKLLYSNVKDMMFAVPGIWSLKQCANESCSLAWLDPAPVESDIPRFYVNYFTHEISDSRKRFLSGVRSAFYRGYLCASYIPSALFGLAKARRLIARMYLQKVKPGSLLDVGCGSGTFLQRMHKLGWAATGLDFDVKAIENAKIRCGEDVKFMHSDLAGARFSSESFDAVTMSHVIEHDLHPVTLLAEARRVLKTKGHLVVTTPNIQGFGHQKFRNCWWGLDSPRHLQLFSPNALLECARKAGFTNIKVISTAANADTFIGGSMGLQRAQTTGDCAFGSQIKINFIRGLRSLLLQYQEAIQMRRNLECGEELVLICEK